MSYKSYADLVQEAKARIRQVSSADAMRDAPADTVYLDCREQNEWNLGRIPGAVFIPRGTLEGKVEGVISRDRNVIIYCASGNRSAFAAETMKQMGYDRVASLSDGFRGWVDAGGDVES